MTSCSYCNCDIPQDSLICPYCGRELPEIFRKQVKIEKQQEEIKLALLIHGFF